MAILIGEDLDFVTETLAAPSVLARADAILSMRILLGDVPDVDWMKLNRMAAFLINPCLDEAAARCQGRGRPIGYFEV